MIPVRNAQIVKEGSQTFRYTGVQMLTGATLWIDLETKFASPPIKQFLPVDSLEFINNSAQPVELYIDTPNSIVYVPAYMIKPVNRPLRRLGIKNMGAGTIAASEIEAHFRRLPE